MAGSRRPEQRLVIEGGVRLKGTVRVSGAKNAILPMLAATVLTSGECVFTGVPRLRDVAVMETILRRLGAAVRWETGPDGTGVLRVSARNLSSHRVSEDLMGEMRSSIFLMGPLLGRLGRARVSTPGGCAIGPRPIDQHLRGLAALGATIRQQGAHIEAEAASLEGTEIHLDIPSVGATENLIMAAVLARGTTVIRNAAREPEIVDLQNFLNRLGARVRGAGRDTIRIDGVRRLGGAEHAIIPDRIEAGTFMVAAAITGGEVILENVIPEHLEAVIAKLREAGVGITEDREAMVLRVRWSSRPRATDFKTLPYPGFPTDMQPQVMALAAVADGTSVITESVFEQRFGHVPELIRMGARIKTEGRIAVVEGVERLTGAALDAPDLRAGAALVLAGLAARGRTVLRGVNHLERGYERFEERLRSLGARVYRLAWPPSVGSVAGGRPSEGGQAEETSRAAWVAG